MSFHVRWTIADESWDEARALVARSLPEWAFEPSPNLGDELLPGFIRFTWNGRAMVPVPVRDAGWADFSIVRHGPRLRQYEATQTFLSREYNLWMAEFAWHLAYALDIERFETAREGTDAWYHMYDAPLMLRFRMASGNVAVLSDEREDLGWMPLVPNEQFFVGVKKILGSFAAALGEQAPDLLRWEVFKSLLPYLPETRKSG